MEGGKTMSNIFVNIIYTIVTITLPLLLLLKSLNKYNKKIYNFIPSIISLIIASIFLFKFGFNMFSKTVDSFHMILFIITIISSIICLIIAIILNKKKVK